MSQFLSWLMDLIVQIGTMHNCSNKLYLKINRLSTRFIFYKKPKNPGWETFELRIWPKALKPKVKFKKLWASDWPKLKLKKAKWY